MARGPKKNVTEDEEVKTAAVEGKKTPGRKPGRPKKNAAAETPVVEEATAVMPASVKPEEPVSEEKPEVSKEPAKRGRKKKTETAAAEVKKEAVKEPAKRGRKKKVDASASEIKLIVQYDGNQIEEKDMIEKIEKAWRAEGNKADIESITMYVKPQDGKIYYVVNGLSGSVDLF